MINHPTLIPENYGEGRTAEEEYCANRGSEFGEPNDYSEIPEPEYDSVEEDVFEYLENTEL